jgi:hypothetical protein
VDLIDVDTGVKGRRRHQSSNWAGQYWQTSVFVMLGRWFALTLLLVLTKTPTPIGRGSKINSMRGKTLEYMPRCIWIVTCPMCRIGGPTYKQLATSSMATSRPWSIGKRVAIIWKHKY